MHLVTDSLLKAVPSAFGDEILSLKDSQENTIRKRVAPFLCLFCIVT